MLEAVIFDLGNTLITYTIDEATLEDNVYKEIRTLFLKAGYSIPKLFFPQSEMEKLKSPQKQLNIEIFLQHSLRNLGMRPEHIAKFVPLIISIIYKHDLSYLALKPSVKRTLKKLRQMSYLLGMISNSSFSYDHIFEILTQCQIANYFDIVLVSSREKVCKPNPKIFKKALRLLGVPATNATFVGDDPQVDIDGAKRVGMETILVVQSEDELTKFRRGNITAVAKVEDLLKYLKK